MLHYTDWFSTLNKREDHQNNSKQLTNFCKGIAIILVVLTHSHQVFNLAPSLTRILSFTQVGTQLFFLLSSWGLCFSYNKSSVSWHVFLKNRIKKLGYGYWAAILITAVYHAVFATVMNKSLKDEVNILGIIINALFLHGFFLDHSINNLVVRGGWFVGAIVILYIFFPLLYKIYNSKHPVWMKIRFWLFPLMCFVISTIPGIIWPKVILFSSTTRFLNNLTPFALGFSLHDLYTSSQFKTIQRPETYASVFLVVSYIIFAYDFQASYIYTSLITISFYFFFVVLHRFFENNNFKKIYHSAITTISSVGRISYSIYLTHSFIAFDFSAVVLLVLRKINQNELLWYIALLPTILILSVFVGYCFDKMIKYLECS